MSLLLLLRNNAPAGTAGYRSIVGWWFGGLHVTPTITGTPWMHYQMQRRAR